MEEKYKLDETGEIITVEVTQLKAFVDCVEDRPSPFKHGKGVGKVEGFEVFIKCVIPENQRTKIAKQRAISSDMICHEVAKRFMDRRYAGKKFVQYKIINCSHFEQQYKYVVA